MAGNNYRKAVKGEVPCIRCVHSREGYWGHSRLVCLRCNLHEFLKIPGIDHAVKFGYTCDSAERVMEGLTA